MSLTSSGCLLTIKPCFSNSLGSSVCVAIVSLLTEQDINAFWVLLAQKTWKNTLCLKMQTGSCSGRRAEPRRLRGWWHSGRGCAPWNGTRHLSRVTWALLTSGSDLGNVGGLLVSSGRATRVGIPSAVRCVWLGTLGGPWGQRPQGWAGWGSAGSWLTDHSPIFTWEMSCILFIPSPCWHLASSWEPSPEGTVGSVTSRATPAWAGTVEGLSVNMSNI